MVQQIVEEGYKDFIKPKEETPGRLTQLPGVNNEDVIPSQPRMIKENSSTPKEVKKIDKEALEKAKKAKEKALKEKQIIKK